MSAYDDIIAWTRGKVGWMADIVAFATQTRDDIAALTAGGLTNALVYGSREISSAVDIQLVAADSMVQSVTMTATGKAVKMPDATTDVEGAPWTIYNAGSNDFTVKNYSGTDIEAVVSAGQTVFLKLLDDTTAAGVWHSVKDSGGVGVDTEARDVNTMQAWKLAELEGTGPLAMVNTISDAFEDETGVDTVTSTNETYDATDDYYHNIAANVAIAQGTGTTIGDMTDAGGIAAAYDSNESQTQTQGARGAIGASAAIGKDFGVSNDKVIKEVTCIGSSDQGFVAAVYTGSLTIDVYGTTDGGTSGGTLIGTTGSFSNVTGPITKVIDCSANTTAYRGYYATVGVIASKQVCFAEVKAEEAGTVLNMTLVSNAFTAASAPSELRGLVDIEEGDSFTINTDATLEVTADGSTWQALTLVEVSTASATRKTYAATVTSGFGTGTTLKYRFKTLNTKEMKLHAVGLQADVELSI